MGYDIRLLVCLRWTYGINIDSIKGEKFMMIVANILHCLLYSSRKCRLCKYSSCLSYKWISFIYCDICAPETTGRQDQKLWRGYITVSLAFMNDESIGKFEGCCRNWYTVYFLAAEDTVIYNSWSVRDKQNQSARRHNKFKTQYHVYMAVEVVYTIPMAPL